MRTMNEYHYTECGLDNIYILSPDYFKSDHDEDGVTIAAIGLLHTTIAVGIISHENAMSGDELRFLRTEFGQTQAEMARLLHCDPQTIARYEKGQTSFPAAVEMVVRIWAKEQLEQRLRGYQKEFGLSVEHLLARLVVDIQQLSQRVVQSAKPQLIEISRDGEGYVLQAA